MKKNSRPQTSAILLFEHSRSAIRAEYILKKHGFEVILTTPPPDIRKGCDLSVMVDAGQQIDAMRLLDRECISYIDLVAFTGGQKPVELSTQKEIDGFIMVKSGNMKLTFSRTSGVIVNISGGGCPDIPSISKQLINTNLATAVRPLDIGYSMCAYLLDRAMFEAKRSFMEQSTC
ncbi:MAG: DUF3343 domain-containing protein [ANME-2 cluster archaeon]|nr:DUF3343 domain-containing protein [ANME-2 cluster archaeon]